jgi:hypothetical protein
VPESMQGFFGMIDTNADGGIDAIEMQRVVEMQQNRNR